MTKKQTKEQNSTPQKSTPQKSTPKKATAKKATAKKATAKKSTSKKSKKGNGLDIGSTVREYRLAAQMTTTLLSKKVGISQAQISRLENNQQGFRSGTLIKIAKVLKVRPWVLFMTPDERQEANKRLNLKN